MEILLAANKPQHVYTYKLHVHCDPGGGVFKICLISISLFQLLMEYMSQTANVHLQFFFKCIIMIINCLHLFFVRICNLFAFIICVVFEDN